LPDFISQVQTRIAKFIFNRPELLRFGHIDGKKAGIVKHLHPHLMRHTFGPALLRVGADLRNVQQLLGHSNLQTTATYLHVDVSRLKADVDRL
jgi:integrase/recombinase XerC